MSLTFTGNSATISTAEYSLPANTDVGVPTSQTTAGIFSFFLDLGNLAAGDSFRFRLYEKYDAAGTQRLAEEWIFSGAQSKPGFVTPPFTIGAGWDFTALKLSGSDRTIYWSIRRVS